MGKEIYLDFINSKYKSTLTELQIIMFSIAKIHMNKENFDDAIYLYANELKQIIHNEENLYRTLKDISKKLLNYPVLIKEDGVIKKDKLITGSYYKNGVLRIQFNNNVTSCLITVSNCFTLKKIIISSFFKYNASFKMYNLLYNFVNNIDSNEECTEISVGLAKLKFMLGIANINYDKIEGKEETLINWNEEYLSLNDADKKYNNWYDFKRYVLDVAKKELDLKSNLKFEYKTKTCNKKVTDIIFSVYRNEKYNDNEFKEKKIKYEKNYYNNSKLIKRKKFYQKYIGYNNLTKEQLNLLLEKANDDEQLVIDAIKRIDFSLYSTIYMNKVISCLEGNNINNKFIKKNMIDEQNWKKIKKNEDYIDFLFDCEMKGINSSTMEDTYTKKELISNYLKWKNKA